MSGLPRIGYVVKVFPRFSETFILNEILEHERAGQLLEVISLRSPTEGRFHAALGAMRSPVTYLEPGAPKPAELWESMREVARFEAMRSDDLEAVLEADVHDAAQAMRLAFLVRERGIDHLHAHFGSVATTVARLAARLARVTYSFTAHAKDIFHQDVDAESLGTKLSDASLVVTVSDFNKRYLEDRFSQAQGRVVRLYNGIDLERFPFRAPDRREKRIVAIGRLVEKKGFADLVDACALLRDRGCQFACQIVGAGPLEPKLHAQISRLDLAGTVELTGPLPQERIGELVHRASVFAAPCVVGDDGNRDGLPTVLLEAMALGTPCVSTPVTGIPELLEHRHTGLLVGEGEPVELAGALDELLDNRGLAARLARAARARIEENFDGRVQAARLRELMAEATGACEPAAVERVRERTPAPEPAYPL